MHARLAALLALVIVAVSFAADRPGALVRLYDIGQDVSALPELVGGQSPNIVKVVPTIDLLDTRGDFGELKAHFLTEVRATLRIDEAGLHIFRLISDDGARLCIDGREVVDHDGLHGATPMDGEVELPPGEHELQIWHFQGGGGAQLTLEWCRPRVDGKEFKVVPADRLYYSDEWSRETSAGQKQFIAPLRRGLPGDGTPVVGPHPGYRNRDFGGLVPFYVGLMVKGGYLWWKENGGKGGGDADLAAYVPAATDSDWVTRFESGGAHVAAVPDDKRVFIDELEGMSQGCTFRFSQGLMSAIEPTGTTAFEMTAVRAMKNGFEIELAKPQDERVGWDPESYYIEQWPVDVESARNGAPPRRDGARYPVKSASVSADRKKVFLEIDDLKTGHVVYIRLLPPCISEDGEQPWSTEAWYMLKEIPTERAGTVRTPPAQPPQNVLTAEERAAGWKLLFDGRTTGDWHGFGKGEMPDGWQVRDGCLVRVGSGGDIVTDEEFGNFELKLQWRISAAGNSGIFYRVAEGGEFKWVWQTGPEMQVLDNAEHADGKNPLTSAGSNYAMHAPVRDVTRPVGLFNDVRIVVNGDRVEHWLNDVKVVEYELRSPEWKELVAGSKFSKMPHYGTQERGHIALQDHGDLVWYRNIKIRPLGASADAD